MFSYKFYIAFLFASLAISIGLQVLLPFPFGLGAALAVFIVLPLLVRKHYIDKRGLGGFFGNAEGKITKSCMACGKKTKGRQCSRCGSSMFKIS